MKLHYIQIKGTKLQRNADNYTVRISMTSWDTHLIAKIITWGGKRWRQYSTHQNKN